MCIRDRIETAAAEGWSSCGIADYHTISGLVRAHQSAIEQSVKLLCGVRLIIDCSEQTEKSEQPIEMQIGNTLVKLKWTLVTAESCTGGALASIFTKNPGASTFFKGSVVSYSNDVKHTVLGVSQDELNRFTVVSEEVAMSMAKGVIRQTGADVAIATTGNFGPKKGTIKKGPSGTLYFAKVENKRHNIFGLWSIELMERLEKDLVVNMVRKVEKWANSIGLKNIEFKSSDTDNFYNINTQEDLIHAENMIKEGADIIDVGGESTRPGASAIDLSLIHI
mgnify:CR=1 FL=1